MQVQKLKSVLEQFLFASHVFILVILLAESRLMIPDWLHMVGRLHPLLLHFPIVVLLLAIGIILFPGLLNNKGEGFHYGSLLLLLGCVFSAVTVIAGLFLSLEDGETTAALRNHKWTGLAVFWLSSLLYWYFRKPVRHVRIQQGMAVGVGVLVIVTGHFGAALTHGENFITAPLFKGDVQLVSLSEAEIFDDVILPILKNKCIGCHKASKQKGELRLDLAEHILKGGETGPALVPGDLENSLMAHRIMLPVEDEDHMPPEGKTQLTEEETNLILEWIKSGGDFEKKLLAYESETPIFQLASRKFEDLPKVYPFKPADPGKVKGLNNFYRKVSPLGPGSPAVSVSYFSRKNFKAASLNELDEIGEQIVMLNLNNMPVNDGDLEHVANFPNLERLDLNFADITGQGLKHLKSLNSLSSLSLAGNALDKGAIDALKELKSLKKLYLWDTGLSPSEAILLGEAMPATGIEMGFSDDGTVYQLNKPTIEFDKAFFTDQVKVEINHSIKSVSIHYTLDGSYPDSINFTLYKEPFVLDSNTVIRARVFADGWTGSEEAGAEFIQASIRPIKYHLKNPPGDRYKGNLVNSLFDGEKGITDVWSLNWIGFMDNPLDVEMEFENPENINSLDLSIWSNSGARFLPPSEVEIWTIREGGEWEMAYHSKLKQPAKGEPSGLKRIPLSFKAEGVEKMRLVARPVASLPSWHGAAGQKAWLMIDELVIN